MDSSFNTRIPYDVLVSVIDELASQRYTAELRACSQTCRMLVHPCYTHLFSTISIHQNASQFAALLHRNPKIQHYVRNLSYYPEDTSEAIANAFLMLDNVETLFMANRYNSYRIREWSSLPLHIQHALLHLCNSPSVTNIRMERFINLPSILLSNCSNLKHLHVVCPTGFTFQVCDTMRPPPKLLSLDVSLYETMPIELEWIYERQTNGLPTLDLSILESLSFPVFRSWKEGYLPVERILRSSPKLKNLCCTLDEYDQHSLQDLSQVLVIALPTLRSLTLEWCKFGVPGYFGPVVEFLAALSSQPNCLNKICISMIVSQSSYLVDQDWEKLDKVLADRQSGFRHMEHLKIELWIVPLVDEDMTLVVQGQMAEIKATRLPQLSSAANDYLDFKVSVNWRLI